jgi:hypothetical protein
VPVDIDLLSQTSNHVNLVSGVIGLFYSDFFSASLVILN